MKLLQKLFTVVLVSYLSLFAVNSVHAQSSTEEITDYKSNIVVNTDTTTHITETITYNFPTYHHGIMWNIPYVYSVKLFKRPTQIHINGVTYYPVSNPTNKITGQYSSEQNSGWYELKIGDPDKEIIGQYIYVIDYTLKYTGIGYFNDHQEVYLNIIGPGWDVPILQSEATVTIPGEIQETICYTGPDGSTQSNCTISQDGNTLNVSLSKPLNANEAFTFAVKVPLGTFDDTTKLQLWEIILGNIGILLPIPVGIFIFGLVKKKGKNKKLTIIPNYTPEPYMDPLREGYLYTLRKENKYISALIIYLAVKGYLTITQQSRRKYTLEKTEKDTESLPEYMKTLYSSIFSVFNPVPLDKLPSTFYTKVAMAFNQLNKALTEEDIFSSQRKKMKNGFIVIAIVAIFALFLAMNFLVNAAAMGWIFGIAISIVLLFIAASKIDIRSEVGNKELYELKGLRLYIETAEEKRIEFHNDPAKYTKVFETLLPFAMIFGLEKKWAKEFEDIYKEPPSWYQGNFNTFNAYYLANSIGTFSSVAATKYTPPYNSSGGYRSGGWSSGGSGFGGGGFSGGGGGGSGGGSW